MELTAAAAWLNTTVAGFDSVLLGAQHLMAEKLGTVLTPLMKLVTLLGEKGLLLIMLSLVLMLFPRSRKIGVCMFGAIACGAILTNFVLKDWVARPRPFETLELYRQYWQTVGAPAEDGFSFPSGHVTACAAGMTAITLMRGKKWIIPSVVTVLLMMISRNYLMAHYPSDVCAALLIGVFSGVVAWFITQLIFRFLNRKRNALPICGLILDFDIADVLPFQLPAIPFLSGKKAEESAPVKANGPAAGDDDVKTYPIKRKAEAAPAGTHVSEAKAAAPKSVERKTAAPVQSAARSGGRHARPEDSRKPARRAPGGYQGKH